MKQFNLETQAWEGEDDPPLTSLKYLQSIYRDENQATTVRIRCAVEALPYENPRMSAVTIATMDGKTFAEALERCIERSSSPPQLNGRTEPLPLEELKQPFPSYRRF
jgi:hypothetical protein